MANIFKLERLVLVGKKLSRRLGEQKSWKANQSNVD